MLYHFEYKCVKKDLIAKMSWFTVNNKKSLLFRDSYILPNNSSTQIYLQENMNNTSTLNQTKNNPKLITFCFFLFNEVITLLKHDSHSAADNV